MKYFQQWLVLPLITSTSAFPHILPEHFDTLAALAHRAETRRPIERRAVAFDPKTQHVDVSGVHAWAAPNFAAGDQRGPCPGLNSLANHAYLPRNGVASWEEIAAVTNGVFGLGEDIAGFLAVYGAIFDGSIVSLSPGYSIGGPTAGNDNILGGAGVLGTPQGLSGSHNKYESDSSSGRYDLYTGGNDYKIDLSRFKALYDLQPATGPSSYDLGVWTVHRKNMFIKSKNENPYFFYAPFAGVIASTGGFSFPPRLMSNKSAAYPDNGILDRDTLKTFFSITGDSNNLTYTYGHERIPDNFYRRAYGNEYTENLFFQDLAMFAEYYPETISTGGNTGKVNSYAALDLGNFTGGVYNSAGLLQGDNLKCFVFQSLLAAAPDVIKGGYDASVQNQVMATLTDKVNTFLGNATCPEIENPNYSQFQQYPGYTQTGASGSL